MMKDERQGGAMPADHYVSSSIITTTASRKSL
jgi:hypothetical protein